MKKFIHVLCQDNRRKWSKLLATFDFIDLILYMYSSGVCEEASISKGSGAKFGSTTSDTADSITE
jgi:hypothetical protein